MNALALLEPQTPDTCPECGTIGLIRDASRGEVVCPGCGLVVGVIVDRSPEWSVYTPEDLALARGTPALIPALSGDDGTYLTKNWSHRDPETQATIHRLMQKQGQNNARDRNFYHARKELFKLGDRANVPRSLLEQAADIYRRAYDRNLVRGRNIYSLMAASIYATYRLQKVPRSVKEMAECMDIERKELSRIYRLLVEELHLSPKTQKAEDHVPRLAEAMEATEEEARAAIDLLREARRLKHTIGKDPRGLAAAALYIAQLPRSKNRITQAQIAQASGVTEITIRNRYKGLLEIAKALFPSVREPMLHERMRSAARTRAKDAPQMDPWSPEDEEMLRKNSHLDAETLQWLLDKRHTLDQIQAKLKAPFPGFSGFPSFPDSPVLEK